jgi:hypothetical protein
MDADLSFSSSHAGMDLVMEGMLAKGFTAAVAPGGVVWVAWPDRRSNMLVALRCLARWR